MSDSAAAGTFLLTEDFLDDWSCGAAWPLGLDLAQPGVDVPSRLPTPNCNYRFKIQNGEPRVPESRFPPSRSAPDTFPNRLSAVGMTRMKKLIGAETSCGGRGSRVRTVREPPLRKSRSMAAISCGVTDCPLGGLRPSTARSGCATVFSPPRSAPDTSPYHLSADFEESMSVFLGGGDLLLGTRLDTVVCAIHCQEWLCYGLFAPSPCPLHLPKSFIGSWDNEDEGINWVGNALRRQRISREGGSRNAPTEITLDGGNKLWGDGLPPGAYAHP